MEFEGRKQSALVEEALGRKPWMAPKGQVGEYRKNDTEMLPEERAQEFQLALTDDLEAIIRRLCPRHPPIRFVQMLDMDVNDMGTGEPALRRAGYLLRGSHPEEHLTGPAKQFHDALTSIGLNITFQQVVGPKRPDQQGIGQRFDNFYVFLFVSLPDRTPEGHRPEVEGDEEGDDED